MGVPIHVQQVSRVDGRIDLRRGQAGVPQQFLEGTQVSATSKQVGRKAVAQSVRGKAFRKAQSSPRGCDRTANEIRIERPSARTDEQGTIAVEGKRTLAHIGLDRFADGRQDRDDAGLRSFPGHAKGRPRR